MSLGFDLWYIWQLEHGRYHTYIFDLGRVEELHDSGLTWLMMFQRWAMKAKIWCSPDELPVRCWGAMHQGGLRDGVGGAPSVYTRRFRPYRIFGPQTQED
jgi:hypothetical protein